MLFSQEECGGTQRDRRLSVAPFEFHSPLLDVHLAFIDWWKRASGDTSRECDPGYVSGNVQLFGNDLCLHFSCPTGGFHRKGESAGDCKGKIPHPHIRKNHVRRSGLSIFSSPSPPIPFVFTVVCAKLLVPGYRKSSQKRRVSF
ncbi:hypothetical protein TNCT_577401 [Trichonephila clavata]|uniref:Uncharacterized protein n=1 Tax=Trichonephila clavata TaxID=2740835 RepID=A0A8X6HRF8_TRICU|nr:hypothetical protein TNCT_577401 [Trichonephila clavata]